MNPIIFVARGQDESKRIWSTQRDPQIPLDDKEVQKDLEMRSYICSTDNSTKLLTLHGKPTNMTHDRRHMILSFFS